MDEYVKREPLLADIESNFRPQLIGLGSSAANVQKIYEYIKNATAEDVVRVVRCQDCAVPHNRWIGCVNLNGLVPPPDFYCARGERKED